MLVRIPYDPRDTRQCRQLFRRPLRVTSGHENPAAGILALHPADRRPRIFIRTLGHRAGIENDNLGIPGTLCTVEAALGKLAFQRRAIRLCRAATKIFYVEACHPFYTTVE